MRKMMLLAAMVAMAALMLAAAPAMANDWNDWNDHHKNNDNDKNNHHNRFFDHDDDDDDDDDDDVRFVFRDDFFDDDVRFVFRDDFGFDFDSDFEQEADSGDVDQSFVVTNTGDNSNQCANVQGVANTGNAQNQLGITQIGSDGDNNNHNWWNNNHNWWNNGNGFSDFELEDVDSTIDVSPISTTTCDQQVNQAASASG